MDSDQTRAQEPGGGTDDIMSDPGPVTTGIASQTNGPAEQRQTSRCARKPHLRSAERDPAFNNHVSFSETARAAPSASNDAMGQLSPAITDRVFPIRSVVSVDPNPTPSRKSDRGDSYFQSPADARRYSVNSGSIDISRHTTSAKPRQSSAERKLEANDSDGNNSRQESTSTLNESNHFHRSSGGSGGQRLPPQLIEDLASGRAESASEKWEPSGDRPSSSRAPSFVSGKSSGKSSGDEHGGLFTARFKHVISEGGHAVITGRDGETLQRCEDEPIHIPGAVQGFGLLVALQEESEGNLVVRIVSENSKTMIGYTPKQLFALDSFTDILSEEQADNLLDHVDFIRDEEANVITNGPEVFTMSVRLPGRRSQKLWCAIHINDRNPGLVICEFELEDDPLNPLVPLNDATPEPPEDTLQSEPSEEEFTESTHKSSKPLRVLRSARKRKGEAAAMEVFNIMSQVQEQLAAAPNLEKFLKILVGVVKELTGFHRVMVYQFDGNWNGRVVTELVDPRATKDLYKGLNFPASDIPKQAREMYKINKVRMLYDRDQETARLVCRTMEDLETPLDLTYSYLRAMSPIHIRYLSNMAVRSSMSISINAFEELWGLIACHTYGAKGMRVSFPIRKMCRLVGDSASRNIERLSYASRLQARKLINTVPTQKNPSGYIIASSEDLLKLFDADFGLLSIRDETKILGNLEHSQEALAMLEYLRMRQITNVMTSQDIREDFPDLRYPPGFQLIAGLLLVPLSAIGGDFIVFFRKGQLKEVKWAGNPYEKYVKEGTEGYLEPRKSFKAWSETVVGKCREWTEEEIETAAVLCLVYGKFIEVWRQKEMAVQNSQLTRLLLANSAHEVRTPLNAIINYLEIAMEGTLDQETRDNLTKSHSASKSLIYVINDLLDLTKTEEGGDLIKGEIFDLKDTLLEATDMFQSDARRKRIKYDIIQQSGIPQSVIGDQRKVRQAISNVTANAIQNTTTGGVKVEMHLVSGSDEKCEVEIIVSDTGAGMNAKKLDALFRELEQVQSESDMVDETMMPDAKTLTAPGNRGETRTLGLGLAVVARIIRNMNGQLRLKSEEGKGSRFVIQFPFDLPETEPKQKSIGSSSSNGTAIPLAEGGQGGQRTPPVVGEVTLIDSDSARRNYDEESRTALTRKKSTESLSKKSLLSFRSGRSAMSQASAASGRSEADRLIEAIQEPHRVEGWHSVENSASRSSSIQRPSLAKHHSVSGATSTGSPIRTRGVTLEVAPVPEYLRENHIGPIGQSNVLDQGTPIRPIRMPDEFGTQVLSMPTSTVSFPGLQEGPDQSETAPTAGHMCVLVAEDDPINSKIIKKRLEKAGHEVFLTVTGEECASVYGDRSGDFDVVLMDMQMPIVDGLTSTKMIRSFEKSDPKRMLSTRASLHGRVPIIAVSASLVERERQTYIDTGFDGWILKPISFVRLAELLKGIVDKHLRKANLYRQGQWEKGGWFEPSQKDIFAADTTPSEQPPLSNASNGVKVAAMTDNPQIKEDSGSEQTK